MGLAAGQRVSSLEEYIPFGADNEEGGTLLCNWEQFGEVHVARIRDIESKRLKDNPFRSINVMRSCKSDINEYLSQFCMDASVPSHICVGKGVTKYSSTDSHVIDFVLAGQRTLLRVSVINHSRQPIILRPQIRKIHIRKNLANRLRKTSA